MMPFCHVNDPTGLTTKQYFSNLGNIVKNSYNRQTSNQRPAALAAPLALTEGLAYDFAITGLRGFLRTARTIHRLYEL